MKSHRIAYRVVLISLLAVGCDDPRLVAVGGGAPDGAVGGDDGATTVSNDAQTTVGSDADPTELAWRAVNVGTTKDLRGVTGTSSTDVWFVGGAMLHGAGAPLTWSLVSAPVEPSPFVGAGAWSASAQEVWAVGNPYFASASLSGTVAESTGDPIDAFSDVSFPYAGGAMNAVWGASRTDLWAVGGAGATMHAVGDPPVWTNLTGANVGNLATLPQIPNANLLAIWGASSTDLWIVGSRESIFHGTGSPIAWSLVSSNSGALTCNPPWPSFCLDLRGVWGSSATDVFAVGHEGTILHGQGAPLVWSPAISGTTTNLTAVWGTSATNVWVVGYGGTLLHGQGSPLTWSAVPSGTTADLFAVWGTSPTDIWAVGAAGTALHYSY